MKPLTDLQTLYAEQVAPQLAALAATREQARRQRRRWLGVFTGLLLALVVVTWTFGLGVVWFVLLAAPAVAALIYLTVAQYKVDEVVPAQVNQLISNALVPNLYKECQYAANLPVGYRYFQESGLFLHLPQNYSGRHLLKGKNADVPFICSELVASFTNGETAQNPPEEVIFEGLFYVSGFRGQFAAPVVVLANNAPQRLGTLGKLLNAYDPYRPPFVPYLRGQFADQFAVYSPDAVEVRRVLDATTQQLLLDFEQTTGREVSVSFIDKRICLAIEGPLLAITPNEALDGATYWQQYYATFAFAASFCLAVNQRLAPVKNELIWDL
ncbi:MAG: DUF3137 domain-containing protein [Bernardetiaceae bacterium]|nr:DUF3137 domain-containing protein [Bernardetiaceae bacterium]